jgi:hypothetical protein
MEGLCAVKLIGQINIKVWFIKTTPGRLVLLRLSVLIDATGVKGIIKKADTGP